VNVEALSGLLDAVTSTFDHMNKKSGEKDSKEHLHIVGTLLMCEMGINLFEPQIKDRIVEMQQKMNQGK
jgi:hypothetical protein